MTDHIPDARKKVDRPQIREVFLRNGFTIAPDRDDLEDRAYEAAFELMEMAAPAVQGEPVAITDADILAIAGRVESCPVSPWWLKDDVAIGDVRAAVLRFARALLVAAPQPAEQQPRSAATIVEQTEQVAATLATALFGSELPAGENFRESENLRAQACWRVAADIQEQLTDTDVENAVAEMEWEELSDYDRGLRDGVLDRLIDEVVAESKLVEALEKLRDRFPQSRYLQNICNEALSAHRKQGGEAP